MKVSYCKKRPVLACLRVLCDLSAKPLRECSVEADEQSASAAACEGKCPV